MTLARTVRRIPGLVLIALLACAVAPSGAAESEDQPRTARAAPVGVGDQAPDFTLPDQTGKPRALSRERAGQDAVVLIFYRGHW